MRYRRLGLPRPYAASRASYALHATRLLARGEYDVAVYDYSAYSPVRLPPDRAVGTVVHMLQGPTARERWGRGAGAAVGALERALLRQSRAICVTSHWLERRIRSVLPAETPTVIVGSGVPDPLFSLARREEQYLLFYGRFDLFQKGIDTLLEACARLFVAWPDLELRIAGQGKDADRIRTLVDEHRFRNRITLSSPVTARQRDELFAGALLLAHPSRLEGLPMVPAEAMAAGVPVIATDVGAMREVVQPPAGGLLIPPDDPGALAEAVERLLEDPTLRASIGARARAAAGRFRWDEVAERHLAFLYSVANSNQIDSPPRAE